MHEQNPHVVVEGRHITKSFADKLFHDLSFEVYEGETLVVMGPSGVGKSTLLNLIGGVDTDYEGEIVYRIPGDWECDLMPIVFQESDTLLPWKSVADNVRFVCPGIDEGFLARILTEFGLDEHRAKKVDELSGGMKQRLGVARAVATRARLILMDEPFGSLDSVMRKQLWQFIKTIRSEFGLTLVLVTHSEEEAAALGDRILRLQPVEKEK